MGLGMMQEDVVDDEGLGVRGDVEGVVCVAMLGKNVDEAVGVDAVDAVDGELAQQLEVDSTELEKTISE